MLKGLFTVYRHELNFLRVSAGTWIFLGLALIAMMLSSFYLGNLFGLNRATLTPFFRYLPWVFMFFVPALAMGAWAEEWRRGTAERLLTLPLSRASLTLGKFLAAWTILFILLVLTAPVVATVAYLGTPDWGPVISSYLGCFLLGGAFLAVAFLCSMLSKSQAGGFSLTLIMLFSVISMGWGTFIGLIEGIVPQYFISTLLQFSVLDRFRQFMVGTIDLRNIIFFLSLIAFFLAATHAVLAFRLGRKAWLAYLVPVFVVLSWFNIASLNWTARFDMTEEKLFTLSDATVKLMENLPSPVTMTFYSSESNSGVPPYARRFAHSVKDMLSDLQQLNPHRINIEMVDVEKDIDTEIKAVRAGLKELSLGAGDGYYMGLSLEMGGRDFIIPALDISRRGFLEFDIISGISQLQKTSRDKILILTELNLGDANTRPRFMSEMLMAYDVDVQPTTDPTIADDIDLVVVFLTPFMGEEGVYALDQYMAKGGKVIMFMDPFLRSAPSADYQVPDRNADNTAIDHPADLLRYWGVEYDYTKVVGDKTRALPVMVEEVGMTSYPMWVFLSEREISRELPFARYLDEMFMIEPGFFEKQELAEGINYEPILFTSDSAQTVERSLYDTMDVQAIGGQLFGEEKSHDIAVMLTGSFPSSFQEMPLFVKDFYDFESGTDISKAALGDVEYPDHVMRSDKEGALIAVADMDFLTDDFAMKDELSVSGEVSKRPSNDNLAFVFNMVQYMLGETDLLSIRGRQEKMRPYVRIERMLTEAALEYQDVEQALTQELYEVSQRLVGLQKRAERENQGSERLVLELRNYREKELTIKKELREIRRKFRAKIERLNNTLIGLNLLGIPMLLAMVGGFVFWRRRRR